MGFVVDATNRMVTVDHSHNHFCVTTPTGNPAIIELNGLKITSIFSRTKGKRDKTLPGDNSPMLYVLKGLHNLTTTRRDIGMLHASFRQILPVYLRSGFQWDWIIPLPSSSSVCYNFAQKVQKISTMGIIQPDALKKISAEQAIENVKSLRISAKDKASLQASIRRFISEHSPTDAFQIKYAKTHLRNHINPFRWGRVLDHASPPRRVLLVDDMVTSGTSLLSAADIISHRYPSVTIEALTLFGSSK